MATDKNPRKELVDTIMESMKTRDGAWQKTWANLSSDNAPYNPITGTKYSGVNFISLALKQTELNTSDSRWCTFKQAVEAGYKITKDSKASQANFYDLKVKLIDGEKDIFITAKSTNEYISKIIKHYRDTYPDKASEIKMALTHANREKNLVPSDKAKLVLFVDELNKATNNNIKILAQNVMKSFPIFNYSQLQNVPELEVKPQGNKFEPIHRAEGILVASGAKIFHDKTNTNYYSQVKHEIHLTPKESFKTPEAYYSTVLHEVAHWTQGDGVTRHLKTNETNNTDNLSYAREELRAELASVFMSSDLNLKPDIQNHSAYLGSYLKVLNNDYNEFFSAVGDAQKIANHVLGFEKRLELENSEAKELQQKNPELYQKIVAFKAQTASLDSTQTENDSTHNFKVGDTYIGKSGDELKKYEVRGVDQDRLRVVDKISDIGQEYSHKSFQQMLDAYGAEKADKVNPQLSINPNYMSIGKEVLHHDFFSLGKQNAENTFIFNTPRAAQQFIDKLTTEHDVPGNMIRASNFARHDKSPSVIMSRSESLQQADPNKIYLENFFAEKNLPLKDFIVNHNGENHFVANTAVIDYLVNSLDSKTQGEVKGILTKLDFANNGLNSFLEYCANAMVVQKEAHIEMDKLAKENTSEATLESKKPEAEKVQEAVDNSINDDNDFSR